MNRVYFTDRDLGKRFPEILAATGLIVERHHDLFPPDGPDEQWLQHCGAKDRIALTHNERIRYTPNELDAVIRYAVVSEELKLMHSMLNCDGADVALGVHIENGVFIKVSGLDNRSISKLDKQGIGISELTNLHGGLPRNNDGVCAVTAVTIVTTVTPSRSSRPSTSPAAIHSRATAATPPGIAN